jgi:mono/diheme cytochrome c family protein
LPLLGLAFFVAGRMGSKGYADDEAAPRQFFETKIRPLLVEKCQSCHSSDEPQSKLAADSLDGLLQGGTRGPAIVPGKPGESLLISAVKHGEILKMPPKEKLTAAQIADLVNWIETGAYWPDVRPRNVKPSRATFEEPEFPEEQLAFWAFQPPRRPKIPDATRPGDFPSPVDRFLDAQLAAAGYLPAHPADKRTLLRRVTFDLVGLPPAPEELDDYLADASPDALERVIDRLLASPHYGVKWGRHWLDVARYGDSNGLDENLAFANAFRYRDYVVSAFNRDLPYDEFVRAQIAGDLLSNVDDRTDASDENASLERIVATGFLSIGPKMLAEDDPVKMQMDIIDEQVETLGKAFLGMTFGCARCHHHKFDPISMHDYYGLAGIFKSTKTMDTFTVVARWHERPLAPAEKIREWTQQKEQIAAKQAEIQQLIADTNDKVLTEARRHLGDYLLAAAQQDRFDEWLSSRQPIGNRTDVGTLSDVIVVEAENFVRGNVLKDTTNYGKDVGVLVNRGDLPNFAEYEIELPRAGGYQVELRYAAAESRPCRILIDGRELKADAAGKTTGGWFPPHQAWFVEGVFELPAGKLVLRLEQPKFFPHIDKLLIAPCDDAPTSHVKLDHAYAVVPTFTQQWRKFLSLLPMEGEGVFQAWREAAQRLRESPGSTGLEELQRIAGDYQVQAERIVAEKQTDDPLGKILFDAQGPFALPKNQEVGFPPDAAAQLKSLRDEKSALEAALPEYPEAMAVSDQTPEDLRIHYRGSHLTLGDVVPRRFPKIISGVGRTASNNSAGVSSDFRGSGRLELASWLTQPDHPLTARVFVNRVWMWHFGEGIVRSVDNFGLLGELPTHPELLDWLATELPRQGWSIKRLHRELMRSAAYQRASRADSEQMQNDPDNRLWGRFIRRRLQVEELRDAILATAGSLDDRMGGSHLTTPNRQYVTSTANVNPDVYRTNRRSIYLPVVRSALYDVLQAFDFADPNVSTGQRQSTTVAAQALFLMNSEFASQQSLTWAHALLDDATLDDSARVDVAYRRALGRLPTSEERTRALQYVAEYAEGEPSQDMRRRAWQSFCRALVSTNEFVFVE